MRVVAGAFTYDFAPFRVPGLAGDLRLRDFTANALAVPLAPSGAAGDLFDPLDGRADLAARRLRACSPGVFGDDPLRVLKGVRHAAVLGFALEEETVSRMREAVALLGRVAPERVRAELAAISAAAPVVRSLTLLRDLGLDREIFGPPAAGGGTQEGLRLAGRMEEVLAALAAAADLTALAATEFEAGLSRAALLKLAAFLRGYRPAGQLERLAGLRLGRKAAAVLSGLTALPAEKAQEAERLPAYGRGRALWAAELASSPVDALLFLPLLRPEAPAAALGRVLPLLRDYLEVAGEGGRIADLVDGHWLRENLGLEEGRGVGEALTALRREEIAGRVRTPEAAREFLRDRQKSR